MASDNDDTAHPHANANANVNVNASPTKPDSPPLLKRSKTISVDTSQTPHFPGPLFPAVRRVSTAPLSASSASASASAFRQPTDLRHSIDNDTVPAPNNAQFFNRDYVFPSCLGPYASKSRLTVKPPKQDLSTSSIPRLSLLSDSTRIKGTPPQQSPPIRPPPNLQQSNQLKPFARPDSASQSILSRSLEPTHSLLHYLVSLSIFTFLLLPQSVSSKLQDITELRV